MKLMNYQTIQDGQLLHAMHSYETLAECYGTPLYIFDEASCVERINRYKNAFNSDKFETEVVFASKALLTRAIAKLIAELGIGQDVVSGGEIYAGISAGVNPKKMYFHGNNKSDDELSYALSQGVGTIVLDNRMEAVRLNKLAQSLQVKQRVLLRLNPGVEAHTHDYIQTATLDSKFGESIYDCDIETVVQMIEALPNLELVGFHSHIGSQIFDETSFFKAASTLLEFSSRMQQVTSLKVRELNFGGGFGVYYTNEDTPFDIVEFLPQFTQYIYEQSQKFGISLEKIAIEPGRSLVNESGSTLYRVGDVKQTVGGKHYAFIDGGMSDNIRPALYQAKYEAMIVNKATQPCTKTYTIAGKACESGDKIIESIDLPEIETGDLLLVNGTGAYNYTMASNYNRLCKPAMIHINGAHHRLTVKRETYEDLMRHELD